MAAGREDGHTRSPTTLSEAVARGGGHGGFVVSGRVCYPGAAAGLAHRCGIGAAKTTSTPHRCERGTGCGPPMISDCWRDLIAGSCCASVAGPSPSAASAGLTGPGCAPVYTPGPASARRHRWLLTLAHAGEQQRRTVAAVGRGQDGR